MVVGLIQGLLVPFALHDPDARVRRRGQQCVPDFMRDDERKHRRRRLVSRLGKFNDVVVKNDDIRFGAMKTRRRETQRQRVRSRQPGYLAMTTT